MMNSFILLILIPIVTFLIMYLSGCFHDRTNPLDLKKNWKNLMVGIGTATAILVMGSLIYVGRGVEM